MVRRDAVLLVEDDDSHREALEALVWLTGLDVVAVRTGAEGLAHLRGEPRRWCLVVLDWWLPDMPGEHFRSKQQLDPRIARIAVVAVTGDARAREAAERAGCTHFLVKPVEPDAVTELLTSHCRGLWLGSTSEEDDCGCLARPRRQHAGGAGGGASLARSRRAARTVLTRRGMGAQEFRDFASLTRTGVWKSVAACTLAERRLAESRRAQERARQVRQLAKRVRVLRSRGQEMSLGSGTLPMPWMLPDGRRGRAAPVDGTLPG